MYQHAYQDPVSKKYWNSITRKFVVRLRASQKGKAKDSAYKKRVKELNITKANAWLPNKLNKEYLKLIFDTLWFYDRDWEMDKILATINTYYFNRYCRGFKNGWLQEDGYLYIPNKQFRRWVHDKDFSKYIEVLQEAGILLRKGFDNNSHDANKAKYSYLINPELVDKSHSQWYNIGYETDRMNLKIHERKKERIKNINLSGTRKLMAQWCEELVREIDFDALFADLESKVNRSRKDDPWNNRKVKKNSFNDLLEITRSLVTGDSFYCNAKDDTGHRFHSPFTNVNEYILQFVRIDGAPVKQSDIINSQMYFFSLCLESTNLVYPLLKDGDTEGKFKRALDYIERFKGNGDLIQFVKLSRSGEIYDVLAKHFHIKRKAAKNMLFKVLFSNKNECHCAKAKVKVIFPSLVELANKLNDESLIPIMMQRLESKVMIDMLSTNLICAGIKFLTCHDSIISKAEDDQVEYIIEKTFRDLGLPKPKINNKENNVHT